jgi:predicted metal-dependent hydrolase
MGFAEGLEHLRRGEHFAAHEELEDAWRAAAAEERDFYQGLVHVAVAWYQAGRGRRPGCERQLAKAERRLGPFVPAHRGVDIASVLAQVRAAAARVEAGSLELEPLDVAEADRIQDVVEGRPQPPVAVEEEEQPKPDE